MATMKIDQLNSPTEQVVESRNVIPIDNFFDDMYLTESEKEERKDLAKNIYLILSAILTIIKANEVLNNPHNTEYYKDYVTSNLEILFDNVFGPGSYRSLIDNFSNEFVDSTMRHIDTPYFTSDDRAIVNAEQQSNGVYNQKQYEDALASGKTHKKWVTMHDQKVRKSHIAADEQKVEIKKPFEVGDSELLFPGDLSLGAHLKEICNCRCVVVYYGNKDTEEPLEKSNNNIPSNLNYVNKAKVVDLFKYDDNNGLSIKSALISKLEDSPIGKIVLKQIADKGLMINFNGTLSENNTPRGARGIQQGKNIIINLNNIKSQRVVEQTIIHEVTHAYYDIGNCQHAEAICFSMEKMYILGRDYLTEDEWDAMVKLAVNNYPELEWEKGGYGDYSQFNFVRKKIE